MVKQSVLCVIPARAGSKRIPGKNIKKFAGKPLIAHSIIQARSLRFVDRVIVDTDSRIIASIAKKYGAEVPFLRPKNLAGDRAQVVDSVAHVLARLKATEGYVPTHILLLQTTSPLREKKDIEMCWKKMRQGGATTVLTVCPTHPRLYHLGKKGELILGNKKIARSTNVQAWEEGYMLNGCFAYITKTEALLRERAIITKKTKAVICPRWRSVDLDTQEDWVLAEFLYTHKKKIEKGLKNFT